MRICIVTPAAPNSLKGNRITALRWARILRGLGHTVRILTEYHRQRTDLLIVLHAWKSYASIEKFKKQHPDFPLVIALAGTDLYRDIRKKTQVINGLNWAKRLIVLQPLGIEEIPSYLHSRTRVIYQSNTVKFFSGSKNTGKFRVCIIGHLRAVKDPLRTALAVRMLPSHSTIEITHIGAALDEQMESIARAEVKSNPRYSWIGEISRSKALRILAGSKLLIHTSQMEGGANVISESISLGVPVISTEIPGSVGLLGSGYPGYFETGNTKELAKLLEKAERDKSFYKALCDYCTALQPLFNLDREKEAWENLLWEAVSQKKVRKPKRYDSRFKVIKLAKRKLDLIRGLEGNKKSISCEYFYDQKGSELFEQICELPEYYLTRTETRILTQKSKQIAALFDKPPDVVELGSGNSVKTGILLRELLKQFGYLKYIPIDISQEILEKGSRNLLDTFSNLDIQAVLGDYLEGLNLLKRKSQNPRLILWLGSSIGNFDRNGAVEFLTQVRKRMIVEDKLLIGIDLRKKPELLVKAYNDSQGVTAKFNLNLLQRINSELDGTFTLDNFYHQAVYNDKPGRIEMYLISRCEHTIHLNHSGQTITFKKDEPIHTENAYKYSFSEIQKLAGNAGFHLDHHLTDARNWFSVNVLTRTIDA